MALTKEQLILLGSAGGVIVLVILIALLSVSGKKRAKEYVFRQSIARNSHTTPTIAKMTGGGSGTNTLPIKILQEDSRISTISQVSVLENSTISPKINSVISNPIMTPPLTPVTTIPNQQPIATPPLTPVTTVPNQQPIATPPLTPNVTENSNVQFTSVRKVPFE